MYVLLSSLFGWLWVNVWFYVSICTLVFWVILSFWAFTACLLNFQGFVLEFFLLWPLKSSLDLFYVLMSYDYVFETLISMLLSNLVILDDSLNYLTLYYSLWMNYYHPCLVYVFIIVFLAWMIMSECMILCLYTHFGLLLMPKGEKKLGLNQELIIK